MIYEKPLNPADHAVNLEITRAYIRLVGIAGVSLEQMLAEVAVILGKQIDLVIDPAEFTETYKAAEFDSVTRVATFEVSGLTFRIKIESRDEIPVTETGV